MNDPFLRPEHVQGSQAWLDMRKNYIGASEAAIVLGISPFSTPLQLWEQKVGVAAPPRENAAMKRGTTLEPLALLSFQNESGLDMYPQIVYHPHHKFMMSSLDGLTIEGDISVEIKCPGIKAHSMALSGEIPPYYMPQLQHQLACLGHDMLWYYSFDGEKGVKIKVLRNDDYIGKLVETERVFWDGVLNHVPPPAGNRDYDSRDTPTWATIGMRLSEIDSTVDALKKEREMLKSELISDSDGRSCRGGGVTLSRSFPIGRINYDLIPELKDVDLNQYRKESKETWTLRLQGKRT